jgi:hypothetical protein
MTPKGAAAAELMILLSMRTILPSWEVSIISASTKSMAETLLIFGVAFMEGTPAAGGPGTVGIDTRATA